MGELCKPTTMFAEPTMLSTVSQDAFTNWCKTHPRDVIRPVKIAGGIEVSRLRQAGDITRGFLRAQQHVVSSLVFPVAARARRYGANFNPELQRAMPIATRRRGAICTARKRGRRQGA